MGGGRPGGPVGSGGWIRLVPAVGASPDPRGQVSSRLRRRLRLVAPWEHVEVCQSGGPRGFRGSPPQVDYGEQAWRDHPLRLILLQAG